MIKITAVRRVAKKHGLKPSAEVFGFLDMAALTLVEESCCKAVQQGAKKLCIEHVQATMQEHSLSITYSQ